MTGRARAAVVVALASATLGAILGCTGDTDRAAPRSTTAPIGDPTQVPATFARQVDGWEAIGATDDVLVGLGGPAAGDDRFGQAFDLETGALTDIPPPPFDDDREVQVELAAFGADQVVVGAFVYGPGIDPAEVDPTLGEPPSELVTYRLDPIARAWTRLSLPGPYVGTHRLSLRALEAVGADGAVALLDGGISQEAVLAVLDGDEWVVTADDGFTDPLASDHCATATAFWQLHTSGGAVQELRPLSLTDGTRLPVRPPARLVDDSWELAAIGCTADAVVLALSDNREQRPAVYTSVDGTTWDEHPDPFGPGAGFLGGTVDGAEAVVVHVGPMDPEPSGRPVVVTAAGDVVPLEAERDDVVVWRGRTHSYLVVDWPEDRGAGDDPLPIRQVDLP